MKGKTYTLRKGNETIEIHTEPGDGGYNWVYVFVEHHEHRHMEMRQFCKIINKLQDHGWKFEGDSVC